MRQYIQILTITFLLTACNQKPSTVIDNNPTDTISHEDMGVMTEIIKQKAVEKRHSFKNISEIVAQNSSIWVEKQPSNEFSVALHFQYKDTLAVSESPGCWIMYPYKLDNHKIIVYWNNKIDTKYDLDIVKAIYKIDNKYIGKPFMILELSNDTTFKATYPIEKIIREINNSNKKRTFFPKVFHVVQGIDLYD